ncbi:MAG: hotdog fold thioesterase [Gemmatimonadaceae bacterium]|jgi:acyl-CoA thioesterase|nr:hotdog fold thioesterase [Gemmatimonadaceae bacterium]
MPDPTPAPRAVVEQLMHRDAFSHWLGIEVLDVRVGHAEVRMTVRDEMVNGFGTAHGGIVFSLADTAFAFAINAAGTLSVAVDCTVSYPVAVRPGDVLTAVGIEESASTRLAFCAVTVRNQLGTVVGHFRGTGYRTTRPLDVSTSTEPSPQ